MDDQAAREGVARVEGLLGELEALGDPRARAKALEAVQALLELYGTGLERIMDRVMERSDAELVQALDHDELVSHLLMVHGLHPVDVEDRVEGALEEVRPNLHSSGGDVELLGVQDGVVRVRLEEGGGGCGCGSAPSPARLAVEEAIAKAAPDVEGVEADLGPPALPVGIPLPLAAHHANGSSAAV